MPFEISSAYDEWQHLFNQCSEGLNNIQVITDKTILYGSDNSYAEVDKSYNALFVALLGRCHQNEMTFSHDKLQFKQANVNFMEHISNMKGLQLPQNYCLGQLPFQKNKIFTCLLNQLVCCWLIAVVHYKSKKKIKTFKQKFPFSNN